MHFVIAFNSEQGEAEDDIGLAASVSVLPKAVLASMFGVPESTFSTFRKVKDRLVMVTKDK